MKQEGKHYPLVKPEEEESVGAFFWSTLKLLCKCAWFGSKFAVKNAPAAIGMAWEIKKEISNEVLKGIEEVHRSLKEQRIEEQIYQLKHEQNAKKKENAYDL